MRKLFLAALASALVSALAAMPASAVERRATAGGKLHTKTLGPTVVYSTTSVKCGNTVYEVSTGTSGGNCGIERPPGGQTSGADCKDGGNMASASCSTGCGTVTGAGSCTIKSAN